MGVASKKFARAFFSQFSVSKFFRNLNTLNVIFNQKISRGWALLDTKFQKKYLFVTFFREFKSRIADIYKKFQFQNKKS